MQLASPALENCVAEQLAHTRSLKAMQNEALIEPAAHEVLQLLQGCRPVGLQVRAAQDSAQIVLADWLHGV